MRLIALKAGRYGTRALKAGDPFDAEPAYGRIWKALGMAADVPPTPNVKADDAKKRGRKPKDAEPAVKVVSENAVAAEAPATEVAADDGPKTTGAVSFMDFDKD